jgi:hypothetical protein
MADEVKVKLRGEAAEVALGEAQAVLSMVADPERRGRLGDLIAAIGEGEVAGAEAQALEELLELGLQSGRLRAVYGPHGEQAALRVYRQLPHGKAVVDSAREVSESLGTLAGEPLDAVALSAVGPGAYVLTLSAGGRELQVRLDRQGARLHSVAV